MVRHRAMTPLDKLSLLNRYLDGEAKEAIRGYLLMPPSEAYDEAYGLLLERYGDSVRVANAFKDRMRAWAKVGGTDARGLRIFVDFLKQCRMAKRSFPTLKVLDDESENVEMMKKLPGWLSRKWTQKISNHRGATGEFPSFSFFVDFLVEEEKVANDPVVRASQKSENIREKGRGVSFASESRGTAPPGVTFRCVYILRRKSRSGDV